MTNHFFVYGTLMEGCSNHCVIPSDSIENIVPAEIDNMNLYMYAGANFPCMIEGNGKVKGEVITIKESHLMSAIKMMDRLEGYHGPHERNFYDRVMKYIKLPNGERVECYVYLFNLENSNSIGTSIPDGDFKNYMYIKGGE